MISTSLIDDIKQQHSFYNLLEYLPKIENSYENFNSTDNVGRFGMKRVYPIYSLISMRNSTQINDYIQHEWLNLYYIFLRHLAKLIIGREEYFVFKLIPFMKNEFNRDGLTMELIAEIMVAESKNVVIPTFTYMDNKVIEWRCGHCSSPNEMKERHCTQCGAPRARLIQELMQ